MQQFGFQLRLSVDGHKAHVRGYESEWCDGVCRYCESEESVFIAHCRVSLLVTAVSAEKIETPPGSTGVALKGKDALLLLIAA